MRLEFKWNKRAREEKFKRKTSIAINMLETQQQ